MSRIIDSSTKAALQAATIYPVWIIALEIETDPVYINTGFANLSFGSGLGYDPQLVGPTFIGSGNILTIDPITDTKNGSQSLKLSLPGVNLADDYLHQIINNGDIWQMMPAYIWMATFSSSYALIGKPIRIKSGRIDQLNIVIDPGASTGTLSAVIESQASYQGQASNFKYSDQSRVDPSDTSQQYVSWLANQVAQIGTPSAIAAGAGNYGVPLGQFPGGRFG